MTRHHRSSTASTVSSTAVRPAAVAASRSAAVIDRPSTRRGPPAVPGVADVAQWREAPARLVGRDLLDLGGTPLPGERDVRGEQVVLPLAEPDPQQAGHRVAGGAGAVGLERRHERPVVLAGAPPEREPARVLLARRLRRQDPRTGIRGPARIVPIDERDARARRHELVGQRGPDEPAADDHDIEADSGRHSSQKPRSDGAGWLFRPAGLRGPDVGAQVDHEPEDHEEPSEAGDAAHGSRRRPPTRASSTAAG